MFHSHKAYDWADDEIKYTVNEYNVTVTKPTIKKMTYWGIECNILREYFSQVSEYGHSKFYIKHDTYY